MIDAQALRERVLEMSRTAYSLGNRGRALAFDRVLELIDDLEEVEERRATPASSDRAQVAALGPASAVPAPALAAASMPWDPSQR
jgi:hypothetical protein